MIPLLLALSLAAAPTIPFEHSYDRFGGMTRIIAGTDLAPSTTFVVTAIHKGREVQPNDQVRYSVKLWRAGRTWRYLSCHTFRMLADDKPVDLPEATHDGRVDGVVAEYIDVGWVSVAAMVQIATAKRVELQVCNDEWVLPRQALLDVQRVLELTTPQVGQPKKETPPPAVEEPLSDRTAHLPE